VSNSGAFERLAAGLNFMCALPRGGGTPSCWGENNHGQLGNGTLINASTPTPVLMPPKTTFTAIAAGDDHVCGLAASKLVYCWGGNAYGQVGNNSDVDQRTPVPVHGAKLWATISLGGGFTCGVELSSQWAYCWGRNHRGQYGVGSDDTRWWYPHSPVEDPNPTIGPIKWKLVKAGGAHACAITVGYDEPANRIWCWGANDYGQTGAVPCTEPPILNCTAPLFSPRQVFSSVDFSGVDLGGEHTCATSLSGGDLYCWGRGSEGQLGRGSTVPVSIPQKIGNVRAINVALGARHTVIRTPNDAAVMAWGNNGNGQVGDGSVVNRSSPVVILP
jgi:alpha-tubulin suppressor-like RCC1 family protein